METAVCTRQPHSSPSSPSTITCTICTSPLPQLVASKQLRHAKGESSAFLRSPTPPPLPCDPLTSVDVLWPRGVTSHSFSSHNRGDPGHGRHPWPLIPNKESCLSSFTHDQLLIPHYTTHPPPLLHSYMPLYLLLPPSRPLPHCHRPIALHGSPSYRLTSPKTRKPSSTTRWRSGRTRRTAFWQCFGRHPSSSDTRSLHTSPWLITWCRRALTCFLSVCGMSSLVGYPSPPFTHGSHFYGQNNLKLYNKNTKYTKNRYDFSFDPFCDING